MFRLPPIFCFNDTATTEIYTLSLHDALPISPLTLVGTCRPDARGLGAVLGRREVGGPLHRLPAVVHRAGLLGAAQRSEVHTSELQSRQYLVCRLLLEKKKVSQELRRAIVVSI